MQVLAVMSGKGGVGKSFISANISLALAELGTPTGLLDLDFHGPSTPKMLGLSGALRVSGDKIIPLEGPHGLKVVSVGFMAPPEAPIIWRGPLKTGTILQLSSSVDWGDVQILVVDLPPGTGDEVITLSTIFRGADTLFVTTPSAVSADVVLRAINFAKKAGLNPRGIVENMAGLFNSNASELVSKRTNVPILARIPFDPRVEKAISMGKPFIDAFPDSDTAKSIFMLARALAEGSL
jgi:ATP-binding protein involved in chromosome partitioning